MWTNVQYSLHWYMLNFISLIFFVYIAEGLYDQ